MTIRTLYMPALIVAAVVVACAAAVATLLAVSKEAEATFPGKNGRIAFVGDGVIYTINPDGSAKRRVTDTRSGGYPIGYSPDGKRITYTDYEGFNGKDLEIYTIGVGGRQDQGHPQQQLRRVLFLLARWQAHSLRGLGRTRPGDLHDRRQREEQGPTHQQRHQRRLPCLRARRQEDRGLERERAIHLHDRRPRGGMSKVVGGSDPSYSPDGRRIAYTGSRFFERDAEIYTVNVDGSHRTKVTNNNTPDYWPSYSPDGKKIAYIRDRGRIPDIYAIDASGRSKSR